MGIPQMDTTFDQQTILNRLALMFKTELNKEYWDNQLEKLHKKNNRLHHLVSGEFEVQILAAVRQSKAEDINLAPAAARHTRIYNAIQRQAKLLHILLQQKLEASAHRCCQVNCDFLELA